MPTRFLLASLALVLVLIATGIGVAVAYVVSIKVPNIAGLRPYVLGSPSEVYAADGSLLGYITSDTLQQNASAGTIPKLLEDATVAIEDQRFYQHRGFDWTGALRAFFKDLTTGKPLQGGSTLTMQLIRNIYLHDTAVQRTVHDKIVEVKLAMQYERHHTKRQILTSYLNSVPYTTVGGQTAIGVVAAARVLFNKSLSQLTLSQEALLAGLPQAPSDYNPYLQPGAAIARRNEVLNKMAQLRYISPARARRAEDAPLHLHSTTYYQQHRDGFFFDYVKQQLIDHYGVRTVQDGGMRVFATIDTKWQLKARAAMKHELDQPGDPSSALVSIDPSNGYIRTMAQSQSYSKSQFNLAAQSQRQAGSTFKAIVLVDAVAHGVDPSSTYYTSQELLPGWLSTYPTYHVQTFGHTYAGSINLVDATLKSDNTVYAQLDADLGPSTVTRTAYKLGVYPGTLHSLPSEGLGGLTHGVSPLEMANVFATIDDGGWRNTPTAIRKVLLPNSAPDTSWGRVHRVKAFSSGVMLTVTKILEQNVQRGTGVNAGFGCPAAGKTGTVDNFTDAWFDGYTPNLATVVWVGYPNAKIPMRSVHGTSVQGGGLPAMIWHDYMSSAIGNHCESFPTSASAVHFQPFNGRFATSGVSSGFVGSTSTAQSGSSQSSGAAHVHHHANAVGGGNGGGTPQGGGGPAAGPPAPGAPPAAAPAPAPAVGGPPASGQSAGGTGAPSG